MAKDTDLYYKHLVPNTCLHTTQALYLILLCPSDSLGELELGVVDVVLDEDGEIWCHFTQKLAAKVQTGSRLPTKSRRGEHTVSLSSPPALLIFSSKDKGN